MRFSWARRSTFSTRVIKNSKNKNSLLLFINCVIFFDFCSDYIITRFLDSNFFVFHLLFLLIEMRNSICIKSGLKSMSRIIESTRLWWWKEQEIVFAAPDENSWGKEENFDTRKNSLETFHPKSAFSSINFFRKLLDIRREIESLTCHKLT